MTRVQAIDETDVIRCHSNPAELDATAWNALLDAQSAPTPFMRMEYLRALHESGSAVPASGWAPQFITVESAGTLRAACALYLKSHSYGEYVFDWSWADAYQRHGLDYYPKGLNAAPFTPVPGSRLLAQDDAWRDRLVEVIRQWAQQRKLSSVHSLFLSADDQAAMGRAGWMLRQGVQFHWTRDETAPAADFAEFLSHMQRDKRKKVQQERRRVADQGIVFSAHEGSQIGEELWDFFYRCYTLTYQAHHSTPYLTRDFFRLMAQTMPRHWLMFVARRGDASGEPVAASLVAIDPDRGAAWGRYWGCVQPLSCVHFEACYYQPLAWCMAQGYQRFEGGAQGEHKMARGLLPVRTASAHWLRDERFATAVADFLAAEGGGIEQYVDELRERNPFKR